MQVPWSGSATRFEPSSSPFGGLSVLQKPFEVAVPEAVLEDLRARLQRVRWPMDVDNDSWQCGAERAYLEELVEHWLNAYDWRHHERRINEFAQFRVTV